MKGLIASILLALLSSPAFAGNNVDCVARSGYGRPLTVGVAPTFHYPLKDSGDVGWTKDMLFDFLNKTYPGHFVAGTYPSNLTINILINNTNGSAPYWAEVYALLDDGGKFYVSEQGFSSPYMLLNALGTKIGERITKGWICN